MLDSNFPSIEAQFLNNSLFKNFNKINIPVYPTINTKFNRKPTSRAPQNHKRIQISPKEKLKAIQLVSHIAYRLLNNLKM